MLKRSNSPNFGVDFGVPLYFQVDFGVQACQKVSCGCYSISFPKCLGVCDLLRHPLHPRVPVRH